MTVHLECQGHHTPYSWRPVDTADLDEDDQEAMGTKEKWWFRDGMYERWLFKEARRKHGQVRGEDWAECLVHSVARLLEIPSACVALGVREGRRGVLVRSVVPSDQRLVHGNELLRDEIDIYDSTKRRSNPNYTLTNIREVLAPYSSGVGNWSAFEMFSSYLTLDALTAARDRHHENWAILAGAGTSTLAPSFDHGNALGFTEPAEKVVKIIEHQETIEHWVQRGRSHHIPGNPALVSVAADALAMVRDEVRLSIVTRLEDFDFNALQSAIESMPREILSVAQGIFVTGILKANRRRLIDEIQRRST